MAVSRKRRIVNIFLIFKTYLSFQITKHITYESQILKCYKHLIYSRCLKIQNDSKTCLKRPLSIPFKIGRSERRSHNAGHI